MNDIRGFADRQLLEFPDVSCKLADQILDIQKWSKMGNTILVRSQVNGE
jgi:hypothetical protein